MVVKETCLIILWIQKEYPEEFALFYDAEKQYSLPKHKQNLGGGCGVRFLGNDALPKLICQSGNKQVQEMGHSAIQ